MAKNISDLLGKTSNAGTTPAGRLEPSEWNSLVEAVIEVQGMVDGTMKGIIYNGGPDNGGQLFNKINDDGYLQMDIIDAEGDVSINVLDIPDPYISSESKCEVTFEVLSKIQQGESIVSAPRACTVKFYIDNGTGERQLVGTDTIYDKDNTTPGVKKKITFDFASVGNVNLTNAAGGNKLSIEVNNGYGKNAIPYDLTVFVIDLQMKVDGFDVKKVYTENDKPVLKATVYGTAAQVQATVDGKTILTNGTANVGDPTAFPLDIFNEVNTHGVHRLKVWATVTKVLEDGDPITISTVPVEYDYIYGTAISDPIVMASIANKNPEKYTNFNVSYIAYKYNPIVGAYSDTVTTAIYMHNGVDASGALVKGTQLMTVNQTVDFDANSNSASGSASFALFPVTIDGVEYDVIGDMVIAIKIGDYEYLDTITVKESSIQLTEASGYAVKLTSVGRSNSEPREKDPSKPDERLVNEWISTCLVSGQTVTTQMLFDDNVEFIDSGSGWMYDGDKYDANDPNDKGNVALRLKKGNYCTLDYKPFANNPTYLSGNNHGSGKGLTVSIEFATRNSLNQAASVISCLSNDALGKPRGFEVLANKATMYSNNFDLYADFKEDTRIKLDIVIEGKQNEYEYDTVSGTGKDGDDVTFAKGTAKEALAIIYIDGVYQALAVIPEETSFMQADGGMPIRFGSAECDLDIYNIKIYNYALNPIQIVQNYSYDTPNVKNKLAIASRNLNVLTIVPETPNKPNINIEGLRLARPELPFFYVEMDTNEDPTETLPQDKSAWKLMKMTQWKNPANADSLLEGAPSFEIANGVMRNQGTSSMTYPWPWRNWDWKTKDDDFPFEEDSLWGKYSIPTIDNPTHKVKYWPQYKGMHNIDSIEGKGDIRKITLKKDYASSEMCNNAITSEMFTDMANGIGGSTPNVLSLAQRNNGGVNSPYRLTFVATPCFMFRKYSDSSKKGSAGTGYEALGMMNLIPNKNECSYLGFHGNYTWDGDTKRSQSWELSDNYPEWFWVKKLDGVIRNSADDSYTNDIDGLYEARYPKDTTVFKDDNGEFDGDFGMVSPDTITELEAQAVMNEQSDLIAFHNWLVDCNRYVAEQYKKEHGQYRQLTPEEMTYDWNIVDGSYNQYDNPQYRLNKFKNEAKDRIIIEQFALYYVWRELFWAYDSGFKNLQIYTMGPRPDGDRPEIMQWGCMVRDADTTLGIQNQGRIEFPPYLEDTDYYVENDGVKTYFFDALKNVYDEREIPTGGKHILNGQLGALWINLRDAFGDVIEDIYTKLHQASNKTNWTANKAIKRFRDHQEKWCESLYNFGMRQYFGGAPFTKWIDSGLGDKKNSRASWLQQAFYYRDSKYKVLSDNAAFRAGTYKTPDFPDGTTYNQQLKFKLYQPCWLALGGDELDPKKVKTHRRITDVSDYIDVTPAELNFPEGFSSAMNVHYGTSNMIEIGDLARVCKFYQVQDWQFPKLKSLLLGHESARDNKVYMEYATDQTGNTYQREIINEDLPELKLDTMTQLQILDVTNHKKIGNFDASMCMQLQELYARGCKSTKTITLPKTTTLNTLYLPSSITSINLDGLTGIKKFVLESPTAGESYGISSLTISNCGSYLAAESYNIVKQVLPTLERIYNAGGEMSCTLGDVNWISCETEYLERLLNINAKLSGYIKIDSLTNALKLRLMNAYGNIDDPNNKLYVEYTPAVINGISMPTKMYIFKPGRHEVTFTIDPEDANTFSHAEWILEDNSFATISSEYADIESAKNGIVVINRKDVAADESTTAARLTVTVHQLPESDGEPRPSYTASCQVYFYERVAKIGDIVFNDGTYSDEITGSNKTAIGVCFYIDPENPENRLMCALESVGKFSWGAYPGNQYNGTYYGSDKDLKINNKPYSFNIVEITDITSSGVSGTNNDTIYFSDDVYRDATNKKNNMFNAFKRSDERIGNNYYGNIGWIYSENRMKIDKLTLPTGETNASISINVDDFIPIGYHNTIALIYNRNQLLDAYVNTKGQEGAFIRPQQTKNDSEFGNLTKTNGLLTQADTWSYESRDYSVNGNTWGSLMYYPAASVCFAYQPSAENLADRFKKYNWFLPTTGEAARILYYIYQSYKDGVAQETPVNSKYGLSYKDAAANAFYNAINLGVLKANTFTGSLSTSTEFDNTNIIQIYSSNGGYISTNKANTSGRVVPICRF